MDKNDDLQKAKTRTNCKYVDLSNFRNWLNKRHGQKPKMGKQMALTGSKVILQFLVDLSMI